MLYGLLTRTTLANGVGANPLSIDAVLRAPGIGPNAVPNILHANGAMYRNGPTVANNVPQVHYGVFEVFTKEALRDA